MRQSLLDTDMLSYAIKERHPAVTARVKQYIRVFRYVSVSVVTVAETVEGLARNQDHEGIAAFLKRVDHFEVLPVDLDEAVMAGEILGALYRTGQQIGELDPFIAAVAIVNGRPLVTNNEKHYRRIVDLGFPLELENWLEP